MRNPETFFLIPAYSRDYRTKKEILADLQANKHFLVFDLDHKSRYHGIYLSLQQMIIGDILRIRYKKTASVAVIKITQKIIDNAQNASSQACYNHDYTPLSLLEKKAK